MRKPIEHELEQDLILRGPNKYKISRINMMVDVKTLACHILLQKQSEERLVEIFQILVISQSSVQGNNRI